MEASGSCEFSLQMQMWTRLERHPNLKFKYYLNHNKALMAGLNAWQSR